MEKSFKYRETKISYTVHGKGNVLVLVHGFGEDGKIFATQVKALQDDYTVLIPDLPGSGKSAFLNRGNITIDDYADVLFELLQEENISSCIMLGHSMGGYITLAFAEKFPAHLAAFGIIHSSAAADNDEKKKARAQAIKMMEAYGAFSFLKNTIPNLFGQSFKKTDNESIDQLIEESRKFSNEALIQYYNAMISRPDRTELLEKTSLPVLFVIGKEDTAAPLDIVINQVHLPKISHIHILDGVGHMGMLEAPGELNNIILEFVSSAAVSL